MGKETNVNTCVQKTELAFYRIHTIFGHIVAGEDMIEKINALPVDNIFRPLQDVKVVKCGELILRPKKKKDKKKKGNSSSESSDSEKETKKKKKEKLREKYFAMIMCHLTSIVKKNYSSKQDEEDEIEIKEEEEAGVPHPLVTTFNISRDEIPSVPANRFLSRVGPEQVDKPQYEQRASRARGKTKSGRTIKGRGTLVSFNFL